MPDKTHVKAVVVCGLMIAAAMICSYLESFIPIGLPGVKPGLANLVVLDCIWLMDPLWVVMIMTVRIVLSGFMFSGMSAMLYSLAGGIVSLTVMLIAKKHTKLSMLGVSIMGGVSHNIAQLIVAASVVRTLAVLSYLPVLLTAGAVAGTIVGLAGRQILPLLKKSGIDF
ncbi:MAG: Gx transporter family protein [Lachnospiraceae bacterium]|nr:Gx transporter family protein [Lachnospiraceae bacterium]